MPTFHLHLKNVPLEAGALDIRRFFSEFNIPDGCVKIVGGPEGNVFITFQSYDQLLEATSYNKRYFMGRQLDVSLVDGNDVKKVMEMSSVQQMSQKRELPSAWGTSAAREFTPPQESTVPSNNPPWFTRRRTATESQLAEYGTVYDGEAKRMRLNNQDPYAERHSSSWTAPSGDVTVRKEKMAKELELELRSAQDIADQLEKKKDRIEKLKLGLQNEDVDTVAMKDPTIGEGRISQMANSRAQWERRQPEPHPRYQYHRENKLPTEPYEDFPRRTMEQPRYEIEEREIYQGSRPTEEPRYDENYGLTESRFEQSLPPVRHGGQNDRYDDEDTIFPGLGTYYEDQMPIIDDKKWDRNTSRDQPQKIRDPFRHNRSPDRDDGHRIRPRDVIPRARTRAPEINKQTKIPDLRSKIPDLRWLVLEKPSLADQSGDYYLQLNSLTPDTTACTVWSWFGGAKGPCCHVTLTSGSGSQENERVAYVDFRDQSSREAEKKKYSGTKSLSKKEALSSIARAGIYPDVVIFRSTKKGVDVIMTKDEKLALLKEWYPQGLTKKSLLASPQVRGPTNTAGSAAHQVRTSRLPAKKAKPSTDNSKAVLYYMTLRSLPKNATASGIRGRFGGSLGHSVGVLLFDQKGTEAEKMAFVAYENYQDRNVQLLKSSKATSWSDAAVYKKCTNGPTGSKVFKTTPTGEDAELSVNEKALLNQEFLQNTSNMQEKSKKEKEEQRLVVNKISRSLFLAKATQKN